MAVNKTKSTTTKASSSKAKVSSKTPATKSTNSKKIFVLDTSVILYDHNAIQNFQEHDVAIPITVLEELDNFKKGNSSLNYEAREVIRIIDKLTENKFTQDWISLGGKNKGSFKVILNGVEGGKYNAVKVFADGKNDNKILNATLSLQAEEKGRQVILVSKDISLRIKAKALNVTAEDYETGKIKDVSTLHSSIVTIENFDDKLIDHMFIYGFVERSKFPSKKIEDNSYYILKNGKKSLLAYANPDTNNLERVEKQSVFGVMPRNAEQTFAIHACMKKHIKLVSLQGVAGTGKTLLALACALEQRREFKQIYITRPIVPLSNKDIGYLPGDINSKLNPYMEPLFDNLKFIKNQFSEKDAEYKQITNMIETEKIEILPLAYIRGRSLSDVFVIVDESQNLSPHEVKTIVSRAGENSKFIFTGDIQQIDTPYLDEQSNGLSFLIDKVKGNRLYAHITLQKGERSELANLANDLL
jgi:PhoH-like ATPase